MTFADLWRELEPLGRDQQTGGYHRYSWTRADTQCRAWFTEQAAKRGLAVEPDNNGNLWAWWDPRSQRRAGAIVTGSHLDSVPDGGGYDGALGVVSALAAVDLLKEKTSWPERPGVRALALVLEKLVLEDVAR
jgi:N-carbamoyl-L-amino-acid hydrolase